MLRQWEIMAKNIDSNSKICVTHINIRQSIFFVMLKLFVLDMMATILAALYFYLALNNNLPEIFNHAMQSYNLLFFLPLFLLKLSLTIYVILAWVNEYYEIWPDFLWHKKGFIVKYEEKHPLAHIRSVKIEQGVFGKFFGYGTITIYNWYLKKYTYMYLIHNPVKYFHIIEGLIPKTEREKESFQEID